MLASFFRKNSKMFFNSYLISKHQKRDLVDILYQKIVNVSRNKVFYTKLNIRDTLDGRYDLLALFSIILTFTLSRSGSKGSEFSQILFDKIFLDLDLSLRELGAGDAGVNIKIKDMNIQYFEVDHKPVKHAFGFNFLYKKKKLTISGDTRPCENLMKYAQKADVLLHEVFIDGEFKETTKMRTKKTLHNVRNYHTPSTIVGKVAKLTRCKKLVLTHLVPTKFNENKLKKTVKFDFGKNPIIGNDLMKIRI